MSIENQNSLHTSGIYYELANLPQASASLSARREWQQLAASSRAEARALIPYEQAKQLISLPISVVEEAPGQKVLLVVTGSGISPDLRLQLGFVAGMETILESADPYTVKRALDAAYRASAEAIHSQIVLAEKQVSGGRRAGPQPALSIKKTEGVPSLLEAVLHRAGTLAASDIHLEPHRDGLRLRFRIDGELREDHAFSVSRPVAENLFRRIKLLAGLDSTCESRPQEGGFGFGSGEQDLRLRVSIIPQVVGEKAVLRVLENHFLRERDQSTGSIFAALGLTPEQEGLLRAQAGAAQGGILLSGPTGSGKSTLLYALIELLNSDWRNIVTLEDPVERIIEGVNQTDVSRNGERDYASMLAPLLRQDPDVIMLGEIRDRQTAETMFHASMTGHLVLSTLHAGSTVEVLLRLLHLGVNGALFSSALRLVVSQRLLPLNCEHCAESVVPNDQLKRFLQTEGSRMRTAKGCERCSFSGVQGRTGVYELLSLHRALKERLSRSATEEPSLQELSELAYGEGVTSLAEQIRRILLEGRISIPSALKALGISPEFLGYGLRNAP